MVGDQDNTDLKPKILKTQDAIQKEDKMYNMGTFY